MKRHRVRLGDVFEIPVSDGRKAYGQYVFRDKRAGMLIRVFNVITKEDVPLEQLRKTDLLFPPVFTSLQAAIREHLWKIVGHLPVEDFAYPLFLTPNIDGSIEDIRGWYLWDGKDYKSIGDRLPDKYKELELDFVLSPYDIAQRIETGKNPNEDWYNK